MLDSVAELYDKWHGEIDNLGVDDATSPWHAMAKRHLGDVAGLTVLEIGCGRGGFSRYLVERGADLVAADISQVAVQITRRCLQGFSGWKAVIADLQAAPFASASFDVVISLETLEHLPDPDQGMRELVRVARPGGKVVISTPNYAGLMGLYRTYREITGRPFTELGQPINQPLKIRDRVTMLKEMGCRIDAVEGCGHYLYIPRHVPVRMRWLDKVPQMRSYAAHSLTVSTRVR